jgi:phenylpropionate dioxygenase-like ring-hydroxylating dioxygenase large terminal subunit
MVKPALPMNPTGWFQVAWSTELAVGEVRRMRYFGQDLVAWRTQSGQVVVNDAYCGHLGAHLGYGGTVVGERLQCPFHGWEWSTEGRNVCIPYQDFAHKGRRIRTFPVVERNESIFIWHDVERRRPYFDVPDVFTAFDDGTSAGDYYVSYPDGVLFREQLELHPQYVLENGVDFAHFKYVHKVPITPRFTRQDFDEPVSFVDFTITFQDDATGSIEDVNSGVEAINAGLGVAVTKSWGMVDNRTQSAVTPVDDRTCDVRFTVWSGRRAGDTSERMPDKARRVTDGVIEQFEADLLIWQHQKYADPASLTAAENDGFTRLRSWAERFYPGTGSYELESSRQQDSHGSSAHDSRQQEASGR